MAQLKQSYNAVLPFRRTFDLDNPPKSSSRQKSTRQSDNCKRSTLGYSPKSKWFTNCQVTKMLSRFIFPNGAYVPKTPASRKQYPVSPSPA